MNPTILRELAEKTTPEHRFFSFVDYAENGCWTWRGALSPKGYGSFSVKGRGIRAHRWSYEYFREPIEPRNFVCHHCDNPSCVNPFHLYQGTASENNSDMIERERHAGANQTHCRRGHKFTKGNTRIATKPDGSNFRICKECRKTVARRYYEKTRNAT